MGAVDIAYGAGMYMLADDQALVMEGTLPACKFAGVVLWNRFLQSFDYVSVLPFLPSLYYVWVVVLFCFWRTGLVLQVDSGSQGWSCKLVAGHRVGICGWQPQAPIRPALQVKITLPFTAVVHDVPSCIALVGLR